MDPFRTHLQLYLQPAPIDLGKTGQEQDSMLVGETSMESIELHTLSTVLPGLKVVEKRSRNMNGSTAKVSQT